MSQSLAPRRARLARAAMRAVVGASVVGALAVPALHAQARPAPLPAGLVKGPTVEGITEYTIPANGLEVLLFPDPSKPQTTVNITYLVGSRHEGYGETGMAHLLEHLSFKGSPRHPNPAKELEAHGARHNGTTSFDRTNYFEVFPSADTTLAWALDLEADRMLHANVAKQDLEKEFSVVRSEFEMGENDPLTVTLKRVLSTAYLFHAYSHLPIGARSDIEHAPIERLQAFYHRYYQPDNAVLLIAGTFDEAKALALVAQKFGRLPRPARTLVPTYTVEPTQDGERTAVVRRVGDNALAMAFYHIPAGTHPDIAAIDVLAKVLGSGPSSRLHKALVEPKRAAGVDAQYFGQHDPGGLFAWTWLKKGDDLDSARAILLATIGEVATTRPPTAEEVARAKTMLASEYDNTLKNSTGLGLELSEYMAMGDWRMFFIHRDRVAAVTPQDVQRVASLYLKPSNRTLGLFVPTDAPDRAEIAAAPSIDSLVRHYQGRAAVAAGEAFDPTPANIERRVTRGALPSGMKLALLPKKTRAEAVNAVIDLRLGTEQSLTGKALIAPMVAAMLDRGTTAHTRQQLRDSLDKLQAKVDVVSPGASGPGQVTVLVSATHATLPATLRLVGEMLHQPSFDANEFEQLRNEQIAAVESERGEPQPMALTAFRRTMTSYPPGHPRYVPTVDERLAALRAITIDDLKKFHAGFYGATGADMAVVGDFDPAEVRKVATDLFGGWRSPQPFRPIPNVVRAVEPAKIALETPDKANAFFVAGVAFPMRDDDPDYPATLLANYIMGGTALGSRLATRIRQKEGLSYIAQSAMPVSSTDAFAEFVGLAIYNPVNADKVDAAFFDEIRKALAEGFTADEVAKAKSGLLQQRKLGRTTDSALAGMLANGLYLGRTARFDADLDAKIAALTPAQVTAAFKKVIDPSRFVVVKAGDFAKTRLSGQRKP